MRRIAILFLCAVGLLAGQMFDAASVKMAPPEPTGMTRVDGGVGEKDSSQVIYRNISITNLLGRAYGPHASWQIAGPDWLDSQRYDVMAKIPVGTTKDQFAAMLQNLLAERFGMKLHHESREFKAYNLVTGKDGAKLRVSSPYTPAMVPAPDDPDHDKDGFPILNRKGSMTYFTSHNGMSVARMVAREQPVSVLLTPLRLELRALVTDQTGLTGTYDFRLEYSPAVLQQMAGENGELQAPGLLTAIRTLGLGVVETKAMQDVLVIDHIERTPTAN